MQLQFLTSLACSIACVAAAPSPTWKPLQRRNATSPCAQVSASAAAQANVAVPNVSGQLAHDCLSSVRLHKPEALALMDSLLPYTLWQTDVSYLKAPPPPPAYLEPAVDIPAQLQAVRDRIENNTYVNEYEFQSDLFRTFNLAHDGHFRFFPDLLTSALRYSRNTSLVSVSLDGSEIPQPYILGDIQAYVAGGSVPSPVTQIDGQDALTYLTNWKERGALNDPDASFNALMFSKPFAAEDKGWQGYFGAGIGRFGYIYPGASTSIGFKNGSSVEFPTVGQVIGDFSGVTDGESFYKKFCNPNPPPTNTTTPTPTPSATIVPGYPSPVVVSSDFIVSGYFLNSTENSDVAVLSMITFEPRIPREFQRVIQNFLADAKAAGKTKLVIDVSANGGGIILNGYDAFRQLFPQIEQDGYTRFRNIEAVQLIADQFAISIPANYSPATASADEINLYESFANYRYDLNLTDQHFESVPAKFGPAQYNGDNFTNIIRWDLDDPLTTINSTFGLGMDITGYRSRRNFTQPFAAEDIILLYDGYCASTCTLFSEFMRIQAGVKSVAIGGRPSYDAMQGVGGVKGANNFDHSYIYFLASAAYESGTPEQQAWANWTALTDLDLLAYNRSTDNSINVRDNILRDNLDDGLPAQFVYEPADCRLFYEPEMMVDVSNVWEAAASAAWGDKKCVQGGLDLRKRSAKDLEGKKAEEERWRRSLRRRQEPDLQPLASYKWRGNVHGQKVPI